MVAVRTAIVRETRSDGGSTVRFVSPMSGEAIVIADLDGAAGTAWVGENN